MNMNGLDSEDMIRFDELVTKANQIQVSHMFQRLKRRLSYWKEINPSPVAVDGYIDELPSKTKEFKGGM